MKRYKAHGLLSQILQENLLPLLLLMKSMTNTEWPGMGGTTHLDGEMAMNEIAMTEIEMAMIEIETGGTERGSIVVAVTTHQATTVMRRMIPLFKLMMITLKRILWRGSSNQGFIENLQGRSPGRKKMTRIVMILSEI